MSDEAVVGGTLALNENWLETTSGGLVTYDNDTVTCEWTGWTYPWQTSTYWGAPLKIRLTLTEILYLRKQAQKDKRLRVILQQFTPYIEIEVDF